MINLTATTSLLEFIYTLLAAVGLAVSLWGLWDAWQDRCALIEEKRNGELMRLAWRNIRRETNRTLAQGFFLAIGSLSMLLPPAVRSAEVAGLGAFVSALFGIGLSALEVIWVAETILDRRDRQYQFALAQVGAALGYGEDDTMAAKRPRRRRSPQVGAIVHYVYPGEFDDEPLVIRPFIVLEVHPNEKLSGQIVVKGERGMEWADLVDHDPDGAKDTWHWDDEFSLPPPDEPTSEEE